MSTYFELTPQFERRKSYYGKARVHVAASGEQTLYSYGTPVARISGARAVLGTDYAFSATTLRHVAEFLRQHGHVAYSKRDYPKHYPIEELAQ